LRQQAYLLVYMASLMNGTSFMFLGGLRTGMMRSRIYAEELLAEWDIFLQPRHFCDGRRWIRQQSPRITAAHEQNRGLQPSNGPYEENL
jgi:hypothetical protein